MCKKSLSSFFWWTPFQVLKAQFSFPSFRDKGLLRIPKFQIQALTFTSLTIFNPFIEWFSSFPSPPGCPTNYGSVGQSGCQCCKDKTGEHIPGCEDTIFIFIFTCQRWLKHQLPKTCCTCAVASLWDSESQPVLLGVLGPGKISSPIPGCTFIFESISR